jgi:Uma2 family endonuclease
MRKFTVAEYHRMIETGILDDTDKVELLEGYVVLKMPRDPPHDGTIQIARKQLSLALPPGWDVHIQSAITLSDSEPEPDLAIVRGDQRTYLSRHPGPADVGQLVEVADSSLDRDRIDKCRIYAGAALPIYWIVNLVDRQIEVYGNPSGHGLLAGYAQRQDFGVRARVPLVLNGVTLASLAVVDLLP